MSSIYNCISIPGTDPDGGFWGSWQPSPLSTTNFFPTNLWTIAKPFARNTRTLFTLISDVKIVHQAVKLPRASHSNSISFCGKIAESGLAWNRISERLDLKFSWWEDPQTLRVLTFGRHIVRAPNQISGSAPGSPSHAHFAIIPADPIHYDFPSDATVKQGGQSDHTIRFATSNMTQIELSITKVTRHSPKSKQATPLHASRRCPNNGLPWYTGSILARPRSPAIVTDELTPSK
jgi:hypothetical protein